jgi:hypothetical protein
MLRSHCGDCVCNETLEFRMSTFAMFTDEGNAAVGMIVQMAKTKRWDWPRTMKELYFLADSDAQLYGEATDTAVREAVYDACGFETNFYV